MHSEKTPATIPDYYDVINAFDSAKVRLLNSMLMLMSLSEERLGEQALDPYKRELYDAVLRMQSHSTRKRNLYMVYQAWDYPWESHVEWEQNMALLRAIANRLRRELGIAPSRYPRRRRRRRPRFHKR